MDVKIEKLIYGGDGLAHADGSTVFVPFVLPEEEVAVEPVERKKKFVRGRVQRLLTPSPERVVPRCPYFHSCGGCHYQHIPYEAQLRYKSEILRETLRRIGRIDWSGPITSHPSPPWGYRNRAQWKVRSTSSGDGSNHGNLGIGYFGAGSTAFIAVDECAILSPCLERTLRSLREAFAARELPSAIREIEAFVDAADRKLLLNVAFTSSATPVSTLAEKFRQILPDAVESMLFHDPGQDRMELLGPGYLLYNVAGNNYRVGHMSFFQVNRFLVEEMMRTVAGDAPAEGLALDLFAGVGLFALPLANCSTRVIAVESNPASLRDLEANLASSRGHVESRGADVEDFIARFREKPQLVVVDPPRAGLDPRALAHLGRLGSEQIRYVSCDPSTLARDLAELLKAGYVIDKVHLFDLFPQTFHIESVVRLARRS
ncbi:MAG: 23S rRNA (uracil(1939)-C(5))-methyltransferase RlmD [Candidatus Acidiferrales bacterium]